MKETLIKLKELSFKEFNIPGINKVDRIVHSFSAIEKIIFGALFATFFISGIFMLWELNNSILVEIPAKGGEHREGIIGFPRFVNPLLAVSEADKDLSALVYSGLMRVSENGKLKEDLAESFQIKDEGTTYVFTLKENLIFHDGYPITSEDVVFTIESAKDEALKSPKRPNWIGVSVEAPDERTIVFKLKQPYTPFLENTTMGILPKHIWGEIGVEQFPFSQFNVEPIGSGPYKVLRVSRNTSGITEYYKLSSFKRFAIGEPYINSISMQFYPNEESLIKAFQKNEVDGINGLSPQRAKEFEQSGLRVERIPLTRVFGVFFNQNQAPVFSNKEVREALDMATEKIRLVNEVLFGYGTPVGNPIPPGILEINRNSALEDYRGDLEDAREKLSENGWKYDEEENLWTKKTKGGTIPLQFSISTGDAPELKMAAEILQETWRRLGALVDVKVFDTGTLNQNIIRPRKYDSLLFGEVVGRDLDLFAFWHSSQRNDPGLNISLYTNIKADELLEETRNNFDIKERTKNFREFEEEIKKDRPAVFLYSPDFIYILPKKIKGFSMETITIAPERFSNINNWYIETDKIWSFLAK